MIADLFALIWLFTYIADCRSAVASSEMIVDLIWQLPSAD
jgi:hypothetical protein